VGGNVEFVVVHAHDDGDVLALRRSGDDDLLGACGDVALGLFGLGEETGGLDDEFDTELGPGELGGGLGGNDKDVVAVETRTSSSALSGEDFLEETVPLNLPWVESYLTR
jgi:hypothetical protein